MYGAKPKNQPIVSNKWQSHWSTGLTVCFMPGGQCFPGLHPHLQWNRVLLLAMSCYIGDPNVIHNLSHAFPCFFLLLAGPSPCNTVTSKSPSQVAGGSPVEALQLYCHTQFHLSSGLIFCFLPGGGGQQFASWGCTDTFNGTVFSC